MVHTLRLPIQFVIAVACLVSAGAVSIAGPPTQLSTTGGQRPAASRDGAWVAYQQPGVGIVKMPAGGGAPVFLAPGVEPDWGRSGDLVLFRAAGLFTVDATTLAVTPVYLGSGIDDDPVWSPLGNEIAVQASTTSIAIVTYPGGIKSNIPCNDPDATDCEGEGPAWSPDGLQLAFEDGDDLLTIARCGGTAEHVLSWRELTEPAWSPDGHWIAVALGDPAPVDSLTAAQSHIWAVDARGESFGLVQLTSGQFQDFNPAWSPDGVFIYFDSNRSGARDIWTIGVSSALPVRKTTLGRVKSLYR